MASAKTGSEMIEDSSKNILTFYQPPFSKPFHTDTTGIFTTG